VRVDRDPLNARGDTRTVPLAYTSTPTMSLAVRKQPVRCASTDHRMLHSGAIKRQSHPVTVRPRHNKRLRNGGARRVYAGRPPRSQRSCQWNVYPWQVQERTQRGQNGRSQPADCQGARDLHPRSGTSARRPQVPRGSGDPQARTPRVLEPAQQMHQSEAGPVGRAPLFLPEQSQLPVCSEHQVNHSKSFLKISRIYLYRCCRFKRVSAFGADVPDTCACKGTTPSPALKRLSVYLYGGYTCWCDWACVLCAVWRTL
jgi:hypothetical protein